MILSPDFKEFVQSLNDNGVRYLVVGGYAVAFHGHPRYTKDLDIWLWLDRQNALLVVAALEKYTVTAPLAGPIGEPRQVQRSGSSGQSVTGPTR